MSAMVRLLLFLAFVATDIFGFGGRSNRYSAWNLGSPHSSSRSRGHQPYSDHTSLGGGNGQRPRTYGHGGNGGMGRYRPQPKPNPYPIIGGSVSQGICRFDPMCFTQTPNMALRNAGSIVRQTPISCEDCLNLCLQRLQSPYPPYVCKAAVYDYQHQSCDIYAVTAGSGPGAQATCVACPGRDFFQPTQAAGTCPVTGGDPAPTTATAGPQTNAPPGTTPHPMTDEPTTAGPETTKTTTTEPEPEDDCPPGESVKLTLIDGEEIKDCYPSDLLDKCPGPTIVEPQKTMAGIAKVVVDADHLRDCIQMCLETTEFLCLSGLFFPDELEQNCVLNDVDQHSRPEIFSDADEKTDVEYFEPCF